MLVTILVISGLLAALCAGGIILYQAYALREGKIVREDDFNGPAQVGATVHAILRYGFKRSIHFRKFILQYVFHTFVRVLYYVDTWSSFLYAKSRNMFVKNAVRNRGTVPHFWEHLKVYKQEMDKEREEKED
jgi:hypothetical protein